jgi:hypothetical protein
MPLLEFMKGRLPIDYVVDRSNVQEIKTLLIYWRQSTDCIMASTVASSARASRTKGTSSCKDQASNNINFQKEAIFILSNNITKSSLAVVDYTLLTRIIIIMPYSG